MTARTDTNSGGPGQNGLYRSADRGIIAGVCAGIANYFGIDVTVTRVVVVVATFFFPPPLILVYVALALLLPKRSLYDTGRDGEDELTRRVRGEPHAALDSVRHKFMDLERRLQRLEKHVTSGRSSLEREFDSLRD